MEDSSDADGVNIFPQLILIIILTLVNAFFASAELAILSVNKSKMKKMASEGNSKAKAVEKLFDDETKFLSTIQVGITLAGFFSSATAAVAISDDLALVLENVGISLEYGKDISMVIVTLILSYFTLVFGELFPKRLALRNPEKIAIVQTAPAVRVALGEEFGMEIGTNVTGKMVTALRTLGFDKVFDTNTGADLTIMEEANEFIERFKENKSIPTYHKDAKAYDVTDAKGNMVGVLYTDFFYYRHNDFWYHTAMQKLPALLDSTGMLACGEDLGMIPACVPSVMDGLKILSLEIQRMPKSVHDNFANPAWYPYLSVCTTSTHDMNPIRAWWEEDRQVTQQFYNEMLGDQGDAPYFCEPWICRQILDQHLWSPAMLTVLPLQDWLSMDGALRRSNPNDERINVPANPRHYWRYRMHLTLDQLAAAEDFNATLSGMIADSGRK